MGSVALNSTFDQAIIGNGYHVFFTAYGDCKGLYVTRKTPTSFEVRELGGGHSNLEFDYRVVGRPKIDQPMTAPVSDDLANTWSE